MSPSAKAQAAAVAPPRYVPHMNVPPSELKDVKNRIYEALLENVLRVHRHPSSNPKVYTGSAGEIIMDMRVFSTLPPKPFPTTPTSSLIAEPFHEPRRGSHIAFLDTSVGPATLILVRQLRLRQNPDSTAHKHARRGKLDAEILEEVELAETWSGAADVLRRAQEIATTEPLSDGGCEVLYGRAGFLYALLQLRAELAVTLADLVHSQKQKDKVVREIEQLCSDGAIGAVVDDIVVRGEFGAKVYQEELEESERAQAPALIWRWHDSRYLGAAHGVVGILHVLLHSPSAIIKPYWDKILTTIEWLLAIQDPLGNWPSKAGLHMHTINGGVAVHDETKHLAVDEEAETDLIQWCHGAPGFMMLFAALLRRTAATPTLPIPPALHDAVVAATSRAGELVYTHGLLRKGVGLCHGVAGSVFALLAASDVLDVPRASPPASPTRGLARGLSLHRPHLHPEAAVEAGPWLARAAYLAELAVGFRALAQEGKMRTPDHAYSLYEGVAGMCCAWAEVYVRLSGHHGAGNGHMNGAKACGMPAYDDLAMLA